MPISPDICFTAAFNLLSETVDVASAMSPYLLLGFIAAGMLSELTPPESVSKHLGGRGAWSCVKAALVGVPIPLCSCGVIPLAASLRALGAGKGATASFLTSTPQTGVDSVIVTWGMLGPVIAIARVVTAFLSGILCGLLVNLFDCDEKTASPQTTHSKPTCCHCSAGTPAKPSSPIARRRASLHGMLRHAFLDIPRDIAPSLTVGLVLAGAIAAFLPTDVLHVQGAGVPASMLLMLAAGIPLYVCSTAAVPMALALMQSGLPVEAAFVFLVAGPAANAAMLATIVQTLGLRSMVIFLLVVSASALAAGSAVGWLVSTPKLPSIDALCGATCAGTGWIQTAGAIALATLILNGFRLRFNFKRHSNGKATT